MPSSGNLYKVFRGLEPGGGRAEDGLPAFRLRLSAGLYPLQVVAARAATLTSTLGVLWSPQAHQLYRLSDCWHLAGGATCYLRS